MKRKLAAVGAALALVGGAVFGTASMAAAEDVVPPVDTPAEVVVETVPETPVEEVVPVEAARVASASVVKVTICHKGGTPAEDETKEVPEAAVEGHLGHGDYLGACIVQEEPANIYGVALYLYQKLDPNAPAAWSNSGPQTLIISDTDNPSKAENPYWTSFPGNLPEGVCGPGWAVQQDKTESEEPYKFPGSIEYPDDNIGWPPIYDAQHTDLEQLTDVPDCEPELTVVVPNPPKAKDLCGLVNDHYGLPEGPEGVTYSRDGLDIVATLETGFAWGEYGAGWTESEGNLVFAFDDELFTDEPCTDPPVKDDEFEWTLELPLCGESTVHEFGFKTHYIFVWENEAWTETTQVTPVERDREVELVECPTEVVPVSQTVVDVCGTANDKVTAPADTDEIDYTLTDTNVLYAEAKDGFVIAEPGEGDKYTLFEGIATFEAPKLTDEKCPENVLAFTGVDAWPLGVAGGFLVLLGVPLTVWYRREKAKQAAQQ